MSALAGGWAGGVCGVKTLLLHSVPPHPCTMVPFKGVWGCPRLEVSCRFLREKAVALPQGSTAVLCPQAEHSSSQSQQPHLHTNCPKKPSPSQPELTQLDSGEP